MFGKLLDMYDEIPKHFILNTMLLLYMLLSRPLNIASQPHESAKYCSACHQLNCMTFNEKGCTQKTLPTAEHDDDDGDDNNDDNDDETTTATATTTTTTTESRKKATSRTGGKRTDGDDDERD